MPIVQHIKILGNAVIVENVGIRILKMFLTLYIEIETKGYFFLDSWDYIVYKEHIIKKEKD